METFVAEYGTVTLIAVLGGILMYAGGVRYVRLSRWLTESKKTTAEVIGLEHVVRSGDHGTYEYHRPTFRYQTTGEVRVTTSDQLFEKGILKTGATHTLRYNPRTPGMVHSDSADDLQLLSAFVLIFLGGIALFVALLGCLIP